MSVSGTGSHTLTLEAFLGSVGFVHSSYDYISHLKSNLTDLPIKSFYMLLRKLPFFRVHTLLRPSITKYDWHRNIKSVFHSPTHYSLGLGPGLLREDKLYPENLGLPAGRILASLLATYSCILTSDTSRVAYASPSTAYRTLSYQLLAQFHSFGS